MAPMSMPYNMNNQTSRSVMRFILSLKDKQMNLNLRIGILNEIMVKFPPSNNS